MGTDYLISSDICPRVKILNFRKKASEDIFIERADFGGTKRMLFAELADLNGFYDIKSWSIESPVLPVDPSCFSSLDSLALSLRACVFRFTSASCLGDLSGCFGKIRLARREASIEIEQNRFCVTLRLSQSITPSKKSETLKQICTALGYHAVQVEVVDNKPVWTVDSNSSFRIQRLGFSESLKVDSPDTFIDLGVTNFVDSLSRSSAMLHGLSEIPSTVAFMCAGDGIDSFNAAREVLNSLFPGWRMWRVETWSPLNEDAVSILNGGPQVEGIDYIPFFQVGVSDRLPSMSFHSIKHHGNDMWQVVSSHHKDRQGMIAWLRSLSPSLYPDSID